MPGSDGVIIAPPNGVTFEGSIEYEITFFTQKMDALVLQANQTKTVHKCCVFFLYVCAFFFHACFICFFGFKNNWFDQSNKSVFEFFFPPCQQYMG